MKSAAVVEVIVAGVSDHATDELAGRKLDAGRLVCLKALTAGSALGIGPSLGRRPVAATTGACDSATTPNAVPAPARRCRRDKTDDG